MVFWFLRAWFLERAELAGLEQVDAGERGAQHVQELLCGRLLVEEAELVQREASVVAVDTAAQCAAGDGAAEQTFGISSTRYQMLLRSPRRSAGPPVAAAA